MISLMNFVLKYAKENKDAVLSQFIEAFLKFRAIVAMDAATLAIYFIPGLVVYRGSRCRPISARSSTIHVSVAPARAGIITASYAAAQHVPVSIPATHCFTSPTASSRAL